jgi:phosphate transport system protein
MINLFSDNPSTTRTHFERQMKRVQQDVLRMGALVENSCWLARQALIDRDLEAAQTIVRKDKKIDVLYRQIEQDCVNLMALQAPVSQDLRLLSAMMQIVRDLERIGDYAQDICEVAVQLFPYPGQSVTERVGLMLDRCRAMVALSLEALSSLDLEAAKSVQDRDDLVDDDYESIYNSLVQKPDLQHGVEPIVLMVLVIRYLERIADHATNIGNRITYIITGERNWTASSVSREPSQP